MDPTQVFAVFDKTPEAFTRIPLATYRLQLHRGFTFRDAAALVPYLPRSASATATSRRSSWPRRARSHGYDVADHSRLNPELGGRGDYEAFAEALRRHGMGLILDVVPNHMGISGTRQRLVDGRPRERPRSPYARLLRHRLARRSSPSCENKVLLPMLGGPVRHGAGEPELRLELRRGRRFFVSYYETPLPGAPRHPTAGPRTGGWPSCERGSGPGTPASARAAEHPHRPRAPADAARRPIPAQGGRARSARRRSSSAGWRALVRTPAEVRAAIEAESARLQRAAGDSPRASTCSTPCSMPGVPPGATGGSPPRRSTTAASSTSTSWPPSAWRTPAVFERGAPAAASAWCARGRRRAAHRPPRRLYAPGQLLPASSSGAAFSSGPRAAWIAAREAERHRRGGATDPAPTSTGGGATAGAPVAGRSTSSPRRSSPATSAARALARRTAPPATIPQRRQRPVRRRRRGEALRRTLRALHRRCAALRPQVAYAKKMTRHRTSMASEINVLGHRLDRIAERNRRSRDFTLNEPDPRPARGHRLLSRLPHLRDAGGSTSPSATGGTSSAAVRRGQAPQPADEPSIFDFVARRAAAARSRAACPEADRAEQLVEFVLQVPAADRPGHGQGRRGHRLLPLQPPGLAQRGGRRAARGSASRVAAFHRLNAARLAALAALAAGHLHPRHQAQRGRAGPDQRAVGDPARVAAPAAPAGHG